MHIANETRPQVRRDRLLRLPEVEAITGLKKSTIYLLMKRRSNTGMPVFPQCVQLTKRCVAWPESHVLTFVQECIASADRPAGPPCVEQVGKRNTEAGQ